MTHVSQDEKSGKISMWNYIFHSGKEYLDEIIALFHGKHPISGKKIYHEKSKIGLFAIYLGITILLFLVNGI